MGTPGSRVVPTFSFGEKMGMELWRHYQSHQAEAGGNKTYERSSDRGGFSVENPPFGDLDVSYR